MDKIKTIKIKNQDGSLSEETYTISADAKNVDMRNGIDLQSAIGDINIESDGSVSEQLKLLNIDIKKKPYYYNTVAEMKADTKLKNGDMAITLGYYKPNDGGGAEYMIVSEEYVGNKKYFKLNNKLFAELLIKEEMNVAQFGAVGDGIIEDTQAIRDAINSGASIINFIKNKTYIITPYTEEGKTSLETHGILIPSNTTINLNQSKVKSITNNKPSYKIFSFWNCSNSVLKNGTITGDLETHDGTADGEWGYGVSIVHCNHIKLENLYIEKCWGDGININFINTQEYESDDIIIQNCTCDSNRRQGMSIEAGNHIFVNNCKFINTGVIKSASPSAGVDIEPLVSNRILDTIIFVNCVFKNNKGMQFVGCGNIDTTVIKNVTLDNCIFEEGTSTSQWVLSMGNVWNGKIINSYFYSKSTISLEPCNDFLFSKNYVEALNFSPYGATNANTTITISDNTFIMPQDKKSNLGFLSNWHSDSILNNNSTLIITGNEFKGTIKGEYIYGYGIITLGYGHGWDKVIITNNYISGGDTAIYISCSAIIKNNIIVGQKSYGICLTGSDEQPSFYDIENNNFQHCGTNSDIIWNYYKNNLVLKYNTYYPFYFNESGDDTYHNKTKWITYTAQGKSIIDNNDIITIESSI